MLDEARGRLSVLGSPVFLLSLCLLLLNDFVLKPQFNNWLTGKLSDFAGLFAFPLFWSALFPRFRRAVYGLTAISFIYWKSSYSQPLIETWNSLPVLPVGRTVDASDLLALLVLPLSFFYFERGKREMRRGLSPYLVAGVSVFAFTATSYRTEFPYDNKYYFPESAAGLTRKVYHLSHIDSRYRPAFCSGGDTTPRNITVDIPSDFCFDDVEATIGVAEEQGQSVITLKKMEHRCPEGWGDKGKLRDIFEKQFIDRLRQVTLAPSAQEMNVEPAPSETPRLRAEGQIYFVSVGDVTAVSVEALASHFRKKYGVSVRVLPKLPLTDGMRSPRFPNSRPVAERIVELLASKYPKIVESRNDLLIGITEDMNVQSDNKIFNYTFDLWGRFALVAVEALRTSTYCEPEDREVLETRLRKAVARHIGALYFELPKSDRPGSVLYSNFGCVDELDSLGEDF